MDTMTYTEEFEIIDTLDVIEHMDGVHETHIQLCSDGVVRAQVMQAVVYTMPCPKVDLDQIPF